MKKIIILAIAAIFVGGMIADVAVAEDRLQLTGEVRARAWDVSTKSLTATYDEVTDELTLDVEDSDLSYFDQRFRVGATINVADGVKGVLRFDFAEDKWGSPDWSGVRYGSGTELQVDRAYLDVTKGMVNIKAGQQLIGLGNYIAYDNNTTGLALTLKTPVTVTLAYTKEDERGSYEDEEDDGTEDLDSYAVQVGFAQDNFGVKGFYAALKDGNDDGVEPNVFGIAGNVTLGKIAITAELDMFGGTIYDTDVMGTQFWGNAEMGLMDNLKVGVDLIYSDGNDTDDEIKITALNDWGDWVIDDRGPFITEITPLGTAGVMDPDPFGFIGDILTAVGADSAGIVGGQGGAMGGGPYAVFTAMEGLDITGQVMYLAADEDSEDGGLYDNVTVLNLGADWMFAPNSHLWVQYSKADYSSEIDELDDSYDVMVAQISINF